MRTPRLAGLGLATMATAAFAVAGCDNGTATPAAGASGTPSAVAPSATLTGSADPAAVSALSKAVGLLDTTSFTVTATSGTGFKLTGSIDAPKGNATAQLTASGPNAEINIKTLLLGNDLYAQVPGITKAGTWTHLDGSRLPAGATIGLKPGQIDPIGTANILGTATDVSSSGPNAYAGSLDLSKAAGMAGLSQVTIDGYGAAAQKVPFTATLDDQGRLTKMTVTPPQGDPIDVTYSGYGQPVSAARPAASAITEAPDSFYNSLGS
jgi:LppX/LprAFG-like lipoprotein